MRDSKRFQNLAFSAGIGIFGGVGMILADLLMARFLPGMADVRVYAHPWARALVRVATAAILMGMLMNWMLNSQTSHRDARGRVASFSLVMSTVLSWRFLALVAGVAIAYGLLDRFLGS